MNHVRCYRSRLDRGVQGGGGCPHAEQVEAGRHAAGDRHVADRDEAVGRVVLDHDPAQHDLIANTVYFSLFKSIFNPPKMCRWPPPAR